MTLGATNGREFVSLLVFKRPPQFCFFRSYFSTNTLKTVERKPLKINVTLSDMGERIDLSRENHQRDTREGVNERLFMSLKRACSLARAWPPLFLSLLTLNNMICVWSLCNLSHDLCSRLLSTEIFSYIEVSSEQLKNLFTSKIVLFGAFWAIVPYSHPNISILF